MSYLIVVAHPDDEVLGAGATIAKLADRGEDVNVCIMSANVEARNHRPETIDLHSDMDLSMSMLGVSKIYKGDFPNIKLNIVPQLELVQFIEQAIIDCNADVLITHHPADLNNDHLQTSIACQAASKLFQRRDDVLPLRQLMFMEVPSATDWAQNTAFRQFTPNLFVEVGESNINKKIKALQMYRGVMREYPHPRSLEVIKGLAAYRGGQSGSNYAEAFEVVFRRDV